MFSPITAADNIKDEFIGYISTLFHISDKDYAAQFAAALREEGAIAKGPYLDVSDSYKTGKSLAHKRRKRSARLRTVLRTKIHVTGAFP